MQVVKGISPNCEKNICLFKFMENGNIKTYTSTNGYATITKERFDEIRKNPRSSDYLLIRKTKKTMI